MKIIKRVFIVILSLACIVFIIGYVVNLKIQKAQDACLERVVQICADYGIYKVDTAVRYLIRDGDFVLNIRGEGASKKKNSEMYKLVNELLWNHVEFSDKHTRVNISFDGKEYKIRGRGSGDSPYMLTIDDNPVYTYVTEEYKEYKESLAYRIPYEGLLEENIRLTSYGSPGRVYTADYNKYINDYPEFAYKIYEWYYPNGELKASATVKYYNDRGYFRTAGYISSIEYYEQSASSQSNFYYSSTKSKANDYYNVEDYSDPEDFYYDYEDDFDDYYDAEDYYYEHID